MNAVITKFVEGSLIVKLNRPEKKGMPLTSS